MADRIALSQSRSMGSPRLVSGFLPNSFPDDVQTGGSPTSILPGQNSPNFGSNPFGYDKIHPRVAESFLNNNRSCEKLEHPKGVGLALIDSLNDEEQPDEQTSKTNSRVVLFGSKLKIQIPSLPASALSPAESPKSPADFGIKTRHSQLLGCLSPLGLENSGLNSKDSPSANLSLTDMELSEDYTCVVSHGPNPKTTHIFDNCIVESCCGVVGLSDLKEKLCISSENQDDFLTCSYSCKNNLGDGNGVYMPKGEKAFCSHECCCCCFPMD